jgi:hypothetical protein
MTLPTLTPVKPEPPKLRGHNGHGGDSHGGNGHSGDEPQPPQETPPPMPTKRNSIWPFLLDVGVVLMLFGLIIFGRFLIVIGAVVFVVALTGWLREARADFSRLSD